MEPCPSCYNDTLTTHSANGLPVCQGCCETFCTQCYRGARYMCAYFKDPSEPPEVNWIAAEEYMSRNPDKKERVVRSGPKVKCAVVREGDQLYRRTMHNGEIVKEVPVDLIEACVYCGSYDRRYPGYASTYHDGFACTECANGILGRR